MAKFKNKKTKGIVEEHLIYYVNKLRNNPNFEEIKDEKPKEEVKEEKKVKE